MLRLAIIVSHPIQYYVPLYRRLAKRRDVEIKVFFTLHGGERAVLDEGFKKELAWDIPLTDGYSFQVIPNTARKPSSYHFFGIRNPALVDAILQWHPDAVFLTGYSYASHLKALYAFHKRNVPVLFRGDSHLLNQESDLRWVAKRLFLSQIYRWPAACLYVGTHNRNYYHTFGVRDEKLFSCPHSIETERFAQPNEQLEKQAAAWRKQIGIDQERVVLLFAGKFERKKRPLELMKAVADHEDSRLMLLMVGDGEYEKEVHQLAAEHPDRFRVLPFQNQTRMPLVYRLGDLFILPSSYNETWGLAVNEAIASGRPVLVSDRVGCAPDLVKEGETGEIFRADDWDDFRDKLSIAVRLAGEIRPLDVVCFARNFSVETTETRLIDALFAVTKKRSAYSAVTSKEQSRLNGAPESSDRPRGFVVGNGKVGK